MSIKGYGTHSNGKRHPVHEKKGVDEKSFSVTEKGMNDKIEVKIDPMKTNGVKVNQKPEVHWTKKLEENKIIKIDVHDIKMIYHNRKPDGHFFDKDTMRFFDSRIIDGFKLNGIVYFITSEQQHESPEFGGDRPRKWTIRMMNKEGNIDTIGDFQEYENLQSAKNQLEKILDAELKKSEKN